MTTDKHACDVLVVGSGGSGCSAALTASLAGADVILVEKEPEFGGTTAYSAGVIWIPNTDHAKAAGIEDSLDQAMEYLEAEIGNHFDRAKAKSFLENGPRMLSLLERETYVKYILMPTWADYHPKQPGGSQGGRSLLPEQFDGRRLADRFKQLRAPLPTMMLFGGMMVGRDDLPHLLNCTRSFKSALYVAKILARQAFDRLSHARGTRIANGNALIARMMLTLFERNVPVWVSSPATRLFYDGDRVTGAVVERDGAEVEITAKKGVILASGGFPANEELKTRYYSHLRDGKNHRSLPPPGNTGDGARLAGEVGGGFGEEVAHPAAWTPVSLVPNSNGGTDPFPHFIDRGKPGVIAVDRRGRRFANEADSYHDFVPAMFEVCRDDEQVEAFLITDHHSIRRYGLGAAPPKPARLEPHVTSGYITRGKTLEELGEKLGIDGKALAETVARFNGPAARGEDPEFDKGNNAYNHFNGDPLQHPNPCVGPLDTAPYYAIRMIPSELGTFAGLRTDPSARVLDGAGTPIAGLYAVGNDQQSVMGGTYPGAGITIGPGMTFGYVAARHALGLED